MKAKKKVPKKPVAEKALSKGKFKVIDCNGVVHSNVFATEAEALKFAEGVGGRLK